MDQDSQIVDLAKGSEVRLEASWDNPVYITVVSGSAEIFGTDLRRGRRYTLRGQKLAVFSFEGATLQLEGSPDVMYTTSETEMYQYLNVHWVLEQRRARAQESDGRGPRVLVVGPTDSGKSTLCRILCSYAVRHGWKPSYVDLDVGQGSVTVPGCLSAVAMEEPADVEEGVPLDSPLVFYYGHVTPSENMDHYKTLVGRVAAFVTNRAESSREAGSSGTVINTMGWVDGPGYELLLHQLESFAADVVLVLGQDRLHAQLQQHCDRAAQAGGRPITVVKLPRSGGVVERPSEARREARNRRVQEYFYGPRADLQPVASTVPSSSLQLYRIGQAAKAPTSALSIGAASLHNPLKIAPTALGIDLENALVAISHSPTPEDALNWNVAGFILLKNIDIRGQTVTYLAPNGQPLPGPVMLAGTVRAQLS